MRRLMAIGVALVAAVGIAVTLGARGGGSDMYRVDAIFDNADYLVPGQQLKIAGAVEGSVTGLHLTPDHHARVEMEVQPGFAPFRSDASCEIRPESLIGEKFVQCDPGSPRGATLTGHDGQPPTVPLANDHSPVDLDLVLSALRLPYRQRLALLVDELGTGLAGRPADLNAAILRANPALDQTHRVLEILKSDRQTLGSLVDASDQALAELSAHRGDVANFIDRANTVAGALASRQGDLGESIHRLPPLLAQLQPASAELEGLATDARPVAADLRAAAKPVNNLLGDLGPLTDAARPTLVKLDQLSNTGLSTVHATMPVARKLLPVASELPPLAQLVRELLESLQTAGAAEGLGKFLYLATALEARFDQFSHMAPSYQIGSTCAQYATTPAPGCSAHWGAAPYSAPAAPKRSSARTSHGAAATRQAASGQPAAAPSTAGSAPAAPAAPSAPGGLSVPSVPAAPSPSPASVNQLLHYLLAP